MWVWIEHPSAEQGSCQRFPAPTHNLSIRINCATWRQAFNLKELGELLHEVISDLPDFVERWKPSTLLSVCCILRVRICDYMKDEPLSEHYSEQDTADKLILPYLSGELGFPASSSLDYQAQHTLRIDEGRSGRYDGLYLSGGYPYAVLEAKRFGHDLEHNDVAQARSYATGPDFDTPVPFFVVSNGREHRFFKRTETIDPADGKLKYDPIPATSWVAITSEAPGAIRRLLDERELLSILLDCKQKTFDDVSALFTDPLTGKYDTSRHPNLSKVLKNILEERRTFYR